MRIGARGLGILFGAATACVPYRAAPVDPAAAPAAYAGRSLADPELRRWVGAHAPPQDGTAWTEAQLAVLALALRPELDVARADVAAARAAIVTAGQRPQPGLQAQTERLVYGRSQGAPWLVAIQPEFLLETGGKRGARVAVAVARTRTEEFTLRDRAWAITGDVRRTVAALEAARGVDSALGALARAYDEASSALERRVDEGAISPAELARFRTDVQGVATELAARNRLRDEFRTRLAGALGVPATALAGVVLAPAPGGGCTWLARSGVPATDSLALEHRYAVAGALSAYAEADAALRLEIARQYPDVRFGPGFTWDQSTNRFVLGLGLPSIALNRNRGPIGEADALRVRAAAVVAQAQEQVLAEVSAARAACARADAERGAADSLLASAVRSADVVELGYRRGERSRLDVPLARLVQARAAVAVAEAAARRRVADADAEFVTGVWLAGAPSPWPDPAEPSPFRTGNQVR